MDNFDLKSVQALIDYVYLGDYGLREGNIETEIPTNPCSIAKSSFDDSVQEENGIPTMDSVTNALAAELLDHIHVNAIAHYYGIQGLVSLTATNIDSLLSERSFERTSTWGLSLVAITEEVIATKGDTKLLDTLAKELAMRTATLLHHRKFRSLLDSPGFAARVIEGMVELMAKKEQELKKIQIARSV